MVGNSPKIAIIGGAGFVGASLARQLEDMKVDYQLFDINDRASNVDYLDVEKAGTLSVLEGFTTLVNLAAVHRDDVLPISRYDDVNVKGAINICNAADAMNIKQIIFTSSVAVYGFSSGDTDEDGAIDFFNDYGRTKFEAEGHYTAWQASNPDSKKLLIIRPTVIFGEGNRGNVYNLFSQIASRKFLMVGAGNNVKSMAYVENVCAFLIHMLFHNQGFQLINYVDKPDYSMKDLVCLVRLTLFNRDDMGMRIPVWIGKLVGLFFDMFSKIVGVKFPISKIRVDKFVSSSTFKSSREPLGFVPPVRLKDALVKTLDYEFIQTRTRV